MRTWLISLALLLSLAACAPAPSGRILFDPIVELAERNDEDYTKHVGFWVTQEGCYDLLLNNEMYGTLLLNGVLNGGWIIACGKVQWDAPSGKVGKCDVYMTYESDMIYEHEVMHCRGADDDYY